MMIKSKKDGQLYDLIEAQAATAVKAATAFKEMVADFQNLSKHTPRIAELEHEGDKLTHELQNKIAATFITPLDKEDLKELSQALDDVTDYIEAAAARAELYRLSEARSELIGLADVMVRVVVMTQEAVGSLRKGFSKTQHLEELLKDIHTAENESDKIFRTALGSLFDEPGLDALTVIKWKELFDRIETAVDKCEDIAAIIGTILIKYA
ncbi:MAG: DUF47 family protein [Fimbriimonadales bacterium]